MINHQLTTTQWLALPIEVRTKLKEAFGIPRSEGAFVQDNKVMSDGHNHRDLSTITMEKMQAYLGVGALPTDTFYGLFDQVIDKIASSLAQEDTEAVSKTDVVMSKPIEELFIEHNGKMYKLTEVVPTANAQVDAHTFPPVAQVPAAPGQAPKTTSPRAKRGPNKPKAK